MKARATAIGFGAATPLHAQAQVCAQLRPDWVSLDGAVTPLQELVIFAQSPLGLALIAFFGVHMLKASRLTLYLTLMAAGFGILVETEMMWAQGHIQALAYSEGCRGLPWATVPVIATLAVVSVLRRRIQRRREP